MLPVKPLYPALLIHIVIFFLIRLYKTQIDCRSPLNNSIEDILEKVKEQTDALPEGEWIKGWGYDDTLLIDQRHPTRDELDRVAPNHPVILFHTSVHVIAVNSKAIELAGIFEDVQDPRGGEFGRYADGRLNGVMYEMSAFSKVTSIIPDYTKEELLNMLEMGTRDYVAQGITTATDAGVGYNGNSEYDALLDGCKEKKIPMRLRLMMLVDYLEEKFTEYSVYGLDKEIIERSGGQARLDSAKFFQDGSIQAYTAALREPYLGRGDIMDGLYRSQQDLNELMAKYHAKGYRIAVHGNGDRAIESNIEAMEYALAQYPRSNHRHRIEHVQTATSDDLQRMHANGIEGSFFINHVYYWGDRHRDIFLGEERARRIDPLKDAIDAGLNITLHSDCPVTPISPLFSIWAAVNRLTSSGKVLGEAQKIDVLTALKAMTIYGAYLNFEEQVTGSIEEGKRADFAVLNADLLTCDPLKIKDIQVVATYVGGKLVYEHEASLLNA